MKPVMQVEHDDCVRAVVASLLELPLVDVPHFTRLGPHWWEHMTCWLHAHGVALMAVEPDDLRPGEHYYVSGPSPSGYIGPGVFLHDGLHAVVYRDERLAHDPNGGGGVVEVLERWVVRPLRVRRDETGEAA